MLFELVKNLHRVFIISRINLLTTSRTGKNNHFDHGSPGSFHFVFLLLITNNRKRKQKMRLQTESKVAHGLNDSI